CNKLIAAPTRPHRATHRYAPPHKTPEPPWPIQYPPPPPEHGGAAVAGCRYRRPLIRFSPPEYSPAVARRHWPAITPAPPPDQTTAGPDNRPPPTAAAGTPPAPPATTAVVIQTSK